MKFQARVAQHRTGQETGLEQHLKAVADAEHRASAPGKRLHLAHDRREPRHGAAAKVIPVRESARQDHDVGALQIGVLVPHVIGVLAEDVSGGVVSVVVAIAAGKNDDCKFHGGELFLIRVGLHPHALAELTQSLGLERRLSASL